MQLKRFGEAVAHVNLGSGSVEMRPAPPDWVRKYVGARGLGLNSRIRPRPQALRQCRSACDRLKPETGSLRRRAAPPGN